MNLEYLMPTNWRKLLASELQSESILKLQAFLEAEYNSKQIYPRVENIFKAFECTPPEEVKVVILGQDPYHGKDQAHGLSFSVPSGVKHPPSLRNIFKELEQSLGEDFSKNGDLTHWARQGVLLLNSVLTVEASKAASHQKMGWEEFTSKVIQYISERNNNVVFMLWGSYAQKKAKFVDEKKHLKLEAVHPSPLSAHRGFFGCRHFILANEYLQKHGKESINW